MKTIFKLNLRNTKILLWVLKLQKKTPDNLTIEMDEEAQPLLLLVILVAYCLFINNIFVLYTLKCPIDELVNCEMKVEKSR